MSLLVPDAEALQYYESRLHKNSIKTKRLNYLGQEAIAFKDVDDLEVLLIANDDYEIRINGRLILIVTFLSSIKF